MNPQTVLNLVFDGVRQSSLGSDYLSQLPQTDLFPLIEHFSKIIWRDPDLLERDINDFNSLDNYVTECSQKGTPSKLNDDTRKALVVLNHLFTRMHEQRGVFSQGPEKGPKLIELGSDRETIQASLADIKEQNKFGGLAEGCILNAAYSCSNADILLSAGRYYLELINADVPTAIAYFIHASKIDKELIAVCDRHIKGFADARSHLYIGVSLWRYLEEWDKFKKTSL